MTLTAMDHAIILRWCCPYRMSSHDSAKQYRAAHISEYTLISPTVSSTASININRAAFSNAANEVVASSLHQRVHHVITAGGLMGKVTRVKEGEDEIEVEIAEGVKVRCVRGTIAQVVSKTEPVKDA